MIRSISSLAISIAAISALAIGLALGPIASAKGPSDYGIDTLKAPQYEDIFRSPATLKQDAFRGFQPDMEISRGFHPNLDVARGFQPNTDVARGFAPNTDVARGLQPLGKNEFA